MSVKHATRKAGLNFNTSGESSVGLVTAPASETKTEEAKAVEKKKQENKANTPVEQKIVSANKTAPADFMMNNSNPSAAFFSLDRSVYEAFMKAVEKENVESASIALKTILEKYLEHPTVFFKDENELAAMVSTQNRIITEELAPISEMCSSVKNADKEEKIKKNFYIGRGLKMRLQAKAEEVGFGTRGNSKLVNAVLKAYLIKMNYLKETES